MRTTMTTITTLALTNGNRVPTGPTEELSRAEVLTTLAEWNASLGSWQTPLEVASATTAPTAWMRPRGANG